MPTPSTPALPGSKPSWAPRVRRASRVPSFSGKASAALLGGCLVFSAVVFPWVMKRPWWVEAEVVLAAWWVTWSAALGWMLHQGRGVSDDHQWNGRGWRGGILDLGGLDVGTVDGGCGEVVAGIAIAVAMAILAFLVLEFVLPAVALLGYVLVRGMVAHVINDPHGCKGQVPASLRWGALWATVYTAPLALLVLALHRF